MTDDEKQDILNQIAETHRGYQPPTVDRIYSALRDAEHRSEKHKSNPWIKTEMEGSAWGPVQITNDTMKSTLPGKSHNLHLSREEIDYVNRYIAIPSISKKHILTGDKDKSLYEGIAKKLITRYWMLSGNVGGIASMWFIGPNWTKKGSRGKWMGSEDWSPNIVNEMESRNPEYLKIYLESLGLDNNKKTTTRDELIIDEINAMKKSLTNDGNLWIKHTLG